MTIILSENIGNANHFYWYEATKNGVVVPKSQTIRKNIERLANYLDTVRGVIGNKPMRITSWYRSPNYNARVKGSSKSQHLTGLAVDFACGSMSPDAIYKVLDAYHGDRGGLGLYPKHLHIDLRGHRARWIKKSY